MNIQEQLDEAQEMYRLLSAQHARLCDLVYEEDGETLKIEAVKQQLGALELSILDGSHPNLMLERAELANKAHECAEAQVALAKERAEVDRLNHWQANYTNDMQKKFDELAAGAVAVQEACADECDRFGSSYFARRIRALKLDPLTAGRELLEPLRRDAKRHRLARTLPGNEKLLRFLEDVCGAPDSPEAYDAAIDAAIAAGGDKT